ncbi:DivIVA domain-containing protein [uncultured Cellulomonas sp.]|uniref:DivIVA domain-containing protein n=1 Tax=uncultured Cellulomonas sp. TaxID=189682 RepID=UPI002612AE31|nr:DivIVA domain-containing protein [uncultured Cellulomonas sp.]
MNQGMFRTVSRLHAGYDPAEVDTFFDHARQVYEGRVSDVLTGRDVRGTAFDLVRGGYVTGAVDAALDRLEAAFASRAREQYIAEHGQAAWMTQLADGARTLYGRLTRPGGERFAPAGRGEAAYDRDDVDALCRRLVAYFDHGEQLSAQDIRSATFGRRRGAAGYAEAPVDAFLARAVEVLMGVE